MNHFLTAGRKNAIFWKSIGYRGVLVCLVLGFSNCQEGNLPEDITGQPNLTAAVRFGPDSTVLNAGQDGYYLYANYTYLSNIDVLVCTGVLAPTDCPDGDCPNTFRLELRNPDTGQVVFMDAFFNPGQYQYAYIDDTTPTGQFNVLLQAAVFQSNYSYQWTLNGIPVGQEPELLLANVTAGRYQVGLQVMADNGLTSIVERNILVPGPDGTNISLNILAKKQGNAFIFNALETGSAAQFLQWNVGGSVDSIVVDSLSSGQLIAVSGVSFQPTPDTATAAIRLAVPGLLDQGPQQTINFSYDATPSGGPDIQQLGKVALQWVDNQGGIWRSDRLSQGSGAYFLIIDKIPYERNELGLPTFQFKLSFSCTVKNIISGEERNLSGNAVMAVAYPE